MDVQDRLSAPEKQLIPLRDEVLRLRPLQGEVRRLRARGRFLERIVGCKCLKQRL